MALPQPAPESKAQKQRKNRQQLAEFRTPAQSKLERRNNCRKHVAAKFKPPKEFMDSTSRTSSQTSSSNSDSALLKSLLESTTASASHSESTLLKGSLESTTAPTSYSESALLKGSSESTTAPTSYSESTLLKGSSESTTTPSSHSESTLLRRLLESKRPSSSSRARSNAVQSGIYGTIQSLYTDKKDEERVEILEPTLSKAQTKNIMMLEVSPMSDGVPVVLAVASTTSISETLSYSKAFTSDSACRTEDMPGNIDFEVISDMKKVDDKFMEMEDTDDLGYQYIVSNNSSLMVKEEPGENKVKNVDLSNLEVMKEKANDNVENMILLQDTNEDKNDDEVYFVDEDFTKATWTPYEYLTSPMNTFKFTKIREFLLPTTTAPIDVFREFFNDQLLDLIVNETNKFATLNSEFNWEGTTKEEILTFIGLILHTGSISMQQLDNYWSSHYLYDLRVFGRFMTRQRFMQILRFLSFSECSNMDDIEIVQPLINNFNSAMNRLYIPRKNLIIDMTTSIFCGNIITPEKKHMDEAQATNIHALAEAKSGVVLNLAVVQRVPQYEEIVEHLLCSKLDCGHSVFLPENYMSIRMVTKLMKRKTYCTGPLPADRCNVTFPPYTCASLYNNGMNLCRFNDQYYLLSSEFANKTTASKPKAASRYESAMATDFNDTVSSYYPCRDITLPWHKKVFIHVLQVALVNAYKLSSTSVFYVFRNTLLERLLPAQGIEQLARHELTIITRKKSRLRRSQTGEMKMTTETVRKVCRGCWRVGIRNRFTTLECPRCPGSPGFCFSCFQKEHTNSTKPL